MGNEEINIINYDKTRLNISLVVFCSVIASFLLIFYQVIVLTNKLALKDLEQSMGNNINIIRTDIETIKVQLSDLRKEKKVLERRN